MEKTINYKRQTAKLTISTEHYHCFLQGFQPISKITLEAPSLRYVSGPLTDPEDMDLIEAVYTEWFKQKVDNL